MSTDHARSVILACCVLHNLLREKSCEDYCPPGLVDTIDVNGRVVNGALRAEQQFNTDIDGTNHHNPPIWHISITRVHFFLHDYYADSDMTVTFAQSC